MWIFVGGLPGASTRAELKQFVLQSAGGRFRLPFLSKRPVVHKVDILEVSDRETGRSELHGLLRVEPEKAGQDLIKRLRMRRFKGVRLDVHRYVRRSWTRDRRALNGHVGAMVDIDSDRRSSDRRRYRLLVGRRSAPRVAPMEQFRRQHGW
ncbi:MAG: hypothetical protein PVF91_00890 [Chromatiales bacterium]|jgi:hypothetical protein